jgi:hypothetical protein
MGRELAQAKDSIAKLKQQVCPEELIKYNYGVILVGCRRLS